MKTEPDHLPKCNIRQAVEWIVFKYEPLPDTLKFHFGYDDMIDRPDYSAGIKEGINILQVALHKGIITATGDDGNGRRPIPTQRQDIYLFDKESDPFPANCIALNPAEDIKLFENVEFDTEDLIKTFPANENTPVLPYTTPYIDIIFEIIKEKDINYKNQGDKIDLENLCHQKLRERGLRDSDNIAKKITTILRLPESQKGMASKIHSKRLKDYYKSIDKTS